MKHPLALLQSALLLAVIAAFPSRAQQWGHPPIVQINPTGATRPSTELAAAVKHSLWQWESRTGLILRYYGTVSSTSADVGGILIRWATDGQANDASRGNISPYAVTLTRTYTSTGKLALADILLNRDKLAGVTDAQFQMVVLHELGHAIAVFKDHGGTEPGDVMYGALSENTMLTANEVQLAGYPAQPCFVEIRPDSDLYFQHIDGFRVVLDYLGGNVWTLGSLVEDGSSPACFAATIDGSMNVAIARARSQTISVQAKLVPIADNTWRLEWAK